tara:strand:+ start:189 stop:455 length:267 start_codon:yes stop_codon:yes gene_type:complete
MLVQYNRFATSPPSGFTIRVGGNKGRPTGPELMACAKDPSKIKQPCTMPINLKKMIKTNDWWYQKGSNSSSSLIHTTGGTYGAVRRRT